MNKTEKKPVKLPVALIDIFDDETEAETMIARATVMDLVRSGKISPRMGAEILGMRYEDLLSILASGEIPLIDCR